LPSDLEASLAGVRLAAFDVDGVLTDGTFSLDGRGEDRVRFHTRDGLALKLLLSEGVEVALVSGRTSEAVRVRAEALGIRHVRLGVTDKAAVLREIAGALEIPRRGVLFAGDDLPDLAAFREAGVAAAVADAAPEVRARAALVTSSPGGRGAVREIAERLLRARGLWDGAVARHSGEG
jgi:3-deoxy-D-manno-octulosonate 8-phosphate phosphatase (KDO 8-P phosphatase)